MLTPEEVHHVAMLARLGLTNQEIEVLRTQLGQVLDYIAMLNEVDTSTIEPTAQVLAQSNVLREDLPRPSLPTGIVLANAPNKEEPFFRVPAVLDDAFRSSVPSGGEVSDNG